MALSGSYDFELNRTKVINGALRALGVLRAGDSVENDSQLEADCSEALNLMLKSWQNIGMQLWTRKQTTVSFTTNTASKTWKFPGGDINAVTPLRVFSAYRRSDSNTDTEMVLVTKDEYDRLSSKQSTGTPTQFYFDYQGTTGTFYPWPVPNSNTNIIVTYHKPFDDMDSNVDSLDFPQSWQEAVKWNLAIRLAPEFGRQTPPEVISLAQITLKNAMENSYEEGSIKFTPSPWMRYR